MRSLARQWPALVIILPFAGYLLYGAIRDLLREIEYAGQTRIVRGHLIGSVGLCLFFADILALFLLSIVTGDLGRWNAPGLLASIVLALAGFLSGNKRVYRIPKGKNSRKVLGDGTQSQSSFHVK